MSLARTTTHAPRDAPRAYAFSNSKVYVLPDEHDEHDGAFVGYVERHTNGRVDVDTIAVDADTLGALEDAAIYSHDAARSETAAWVRDATDVHAGP